MSVSAQNGYISYAIQAAGKIGDTVNIKTFDPATVAWLNHRALSADVSVQQLVDALPPEVGGGLFTSTTFKMGAFVAGGYALDARMKDTLGYLLYAAAGKASTGTATAPGTYSGSTRFRVDPLDDTSMPWMSLRRVIPAASSGDAQIEYFTDCRIAALALTMPAMGVMRAEFSFMGRKPVWVDGVPVVGTGAGQVGKAFEDGTTIGLSSEGTVSVPDFTHAQLPYGGKFSGAQIILANNLSRPQDEMIIGSPYPDDFTPMSRGAVVRLIYKWSDAKLYRHLTMGAPQTGLRYWDATIKSSSVFIKSASVTPVPTFTNPYAAFFKAPSVDWSMSPITLAPQQLLQVELIGTIKQATTGTSTWEIALENDAVYTPIIT